MTTTVIIEAHCSADVEVRVTVTDEGMLSEDFVIQNGERAERYVFDNRSISVREQERIRVSP